MAVMYFASKEQAPIGALLGNSLAYGALIALVVPAAYLAHQPLADLVARGRGDDALWALAAAIVPVSFLEWTTQNQVIASLRFGLYNALVVAARLVALAVAVLTIGVLGFGVAGGLAALLAASAVTIAGCLPLLLRHARPRLDVGLFRRLVRYGSRVQVGTLFQLLNYRLDVIVVGFFLPLTLVGSYAMAQVLAELVLILAQAFQTGVLPLVARAEGTAIGDRTAATALRHHTVAAIAAIGANAAFGALVIWFLLGRSYHEALAPFFILLPGMFFLGTGTVVTGALRGRDRPGTASILTGLTLIVTIVLDLILIPRHGIVGAAIASSCAYTFFGTAGVIVLGRMLGIAPRVLVAPTRGDFALYRRAAGWLRRARA
jgi:O-antigen/teichoic acid export membrane protein